MNVINEIINPLVAEFSKGKSVSLLMSRGRIEALPSIKGNYFYDLNELKLGWFISIALSKSGAEIMLLEGVLAEGGEGTEVTLRSIPYRQALWGDLERTHAKFLNRNNETKYRKNHYQKRNSGMVGYLHKQMFGTRW